MSREKNPEWYVPLPCPHCGKLHTPSDYRPQPHLQRQRGPDDLVEPGMPHNPNDVLCSCGTLLRYSVPVFHPGTPGGWVWQDVTARQVSG